MRRRLSRTLILALLIIAGNFWIGSDRKTSQKVVLAESQLSATLKDGLMPTVEGDFYIQRAGWSRETRVRESIRIYPGDLIKPVSGTRVTVMCSDGTLRRPPEKIWSSLSTLGCPTNLEPSLLRDGSRIRPPRNPFDPEVPYIISPRSTMLLFGNKPTLRWYDARGANSYEVQIILVDESQPEEVVWERKGFKETTVSPDNLYLQPGATYRLKVQANNNQTNSNKSSDDEGVDIDFKVLSELETQRILMAKQEIDSLEVSDELKAIVIADFYTQQNLIFDAIHVLKKAINNNKTAIFYRTVGDLYYKIGLPREAKPYYLESLNQASDNVEEQALALKQLGEVEAWLGRRDEAVRQLKRARAKYKLLGDLLHVQKLTDRIDDLSK